MHCIDVDVAKVPNAGHDFGSTTSNEGWDFSEDGWVVSDYFLLENSMTLVCLHLAA